MEHQINKAIEAIIAKGTKAPFHPCGILLNDGIVHLSNEKSYLLINGLEALNRTGKGTGREIMKVVLDACDQFQIKCSLSIAPYSNYYLGMNDLKAWYAERAEGDMPKFLKDTVNDNGIIRAEKIEVAGHVKYITSPDLKLGGTKYLQNYVPVTEQEYTTYNQSQK